MGTFSEARRGHAALSSVRVSLARPVYLVTFTTAERRRHFADWDVAAPACRAMASPLQWQRSRLLAWVLMPDHWHGLVALGEFDELSACVGRLKGRSSRLLREADPAAGAVWASAFYDHAIGDERAMIQAARYLVMNPVRAGLVRRVGDYPFWDARWL
ncbi:MAG: REP-associated tyrosine transposase [Lysobacter sp.]